MHAGLLDVKSACSGEVHSPVSEAGAAAAAAAVWQGSMKDLSALWPSLRQLLLAGAVQRLAGRSSESLEAGAQLKSALREWHNLHDFLCDTVSCFRFSGCKLVQACLLE